MLGGVNNTHVSFMPPGNWSAAWRECFGFAVTRVDVYCTDGRSRKPWSICICTQEKPRLSRFRVMQLWSFCIKWNETRWSRISRVTLIIHHTDKQTRWSRLGTHASFVILHAPRKDPNVLMYAVCRCRWQYQSQDHHQDAEWLRLGMIFKQMVTGKFSTLHCIHYV